MPIESAAFHPGDGVAATTVHFPVMVRQPCPRRRACTTATRGGRSIALHPQEGFLLTLRAAQQDPAGRARLRTRITIEHRSRECNSSKDQKRATRGYAKTPSTSGASRPLLIFNGSPGSRSRRDFTCSAL